MTKNQQDPITIIAHVAIGATTSEDGLVAQLLTTIEVLKQKVIDLDKGNETVSCDSITLALTLVRTQIPTTQIVLENLANLIVTPSIDSNNSRTFITKEQIQEALGIKTEIASKALATVDF